MFRTAYETKTLECACSPSGEKIEYEHREEIDKNGKRKLIKDRAVNIYDKIQSSREQCEISTILRRACEGDTSVLNLINGQYLDITGAPSSLAEAQQFVIRVKAEFDQLDKETRAKFENNPEIYVAEYGTDNWEDKTGIKALKEAEKARKEAEKELKKNQEKAFANLAEKGAVTNE